jgi:hypothetical protein
MKRRLGIAVGLALVLSAGCTKDEAEGAKRAVEAGKEIKKEASGPVGWMLEQAEREQKQRADQEARLRQTIADVEHLLAEGKLDEAEAKAVNISWTPIHSAENSTDKLMVEQYDEKRRTLMNIIQRRRQEKGR